MTAAPRRRGLLVEEESRTSIARFLYCALRQASGVPLYFLPSLKHDVVVSGKEHVTGHHPTLIVANHKRHLDSVILITQLSFLRGLHKLNQRLCFGLNEVWFEPELLAQFLGWRQPWRWLLEHLSIGPHLRFMNAWPIGRFPRRDRLGQLHTQLARFVALLDSGHDVLWTPEGGLVSDGTLRPFRAGLYRMVAAARVPPTVQPVAVCYDFMTAGRMRCFMRIGPEESIEPLPGRAELEERVRRAILRSMTVNLGHLAAAILRDGPGAMTEAAFEEHVLQGAVRLRRAGCYIDPRLKDRRGLQRRARSFLAYAERNAILRRDGHLWLAAAGPEHPQLAYALNELRQIEEVYGLH